MDVPDDLRYTTDHEWVRLEGIGSRIGITEYAQDALGDVVFVQVPEVGTAVERGATGERGRVDQVGLRHLRPGRRDRSSRSTPTWPTRPSG